MNKLTKYTINKKIINKMTNMVISNYPMVLLLIIAITIPLGYFFTQQKHHNDVEIYFNKDDSEIKFYNKFKEIYGNEQYIVIAFKEKEIFTRTNIQIIKDISNGIKSIKGVQRVFSLSESEEAIAEDDQIEFRKLIPEENFTEEDLVKAKDRALKNKMIIKSLLSQDGKTTAILAELEDMPKAKREVLLNKITILAKKIAGTKVKLYFSGQPFVEIELTKLSKRDFMLFTPIVFILIFVVILLLMKNSILSILCQLNLLLALIWAIGFFVLCGETLNMVTTIMGPVVLAISIAYAVHLLSKYKENFTVYKLDHELATSNATTNVWLPCLFTSVTTAVGFLSFVTSTIRPIKIVGIYTAIGVLFAFILTVTFLPTLLIIFKDKIIKSFNKNIKNISSQNDESNKFTLMLKLIAKFSTERTHLIATIFILMMIISGIGISKIKFETNLMEYLPSDNEFKHHSKFIENNLGGTTPLILLIQSKGDKDFTQPESIKLLDSIQTDLMGQIKNFTTSSSIADYIKQMNKAFNNDKKEFHTIPDTGEEIMEYYELSNIDLLYRVLNPDYNEARITFQSLWVSNEQGHKLFDSMHKYLKNKLKNHKGYTYRMTGRTPIYLAMERNLRNSQMQSFFIAIVIVFIMMLFVCRSLVLGILSMIPNVFPIALTLGIMGWKGIPMDVSTIMIASITIGIAVDDTIHFVVAMRRNIGLGMDMESNILKSIKDVGKPIVITTILLFIGFISLVLGQTLPTRTFGLLTALAMFFALVGDLVILPAVMLILKPKIPEIK